MVDALGHPITEGCVVLTPGYWSPTASVVTKVKKVTKAYIFVELVASRWRDNDWAKIDVVVRRRPHQVVVVDKQLKHNRKTYPEFII